MDSDRIVGTARSAAGKIETQFGKATGDAKSQAEGALRNAAGRVQDFYGQAKDVASDAVDEISDTAFSLEEQVREKIEANPFIAIAFAFGAGLVLSRVIRSRS